VLWFRIGIGIGLIGRLVRLDVNVRVTGSASVAHPLQEQQCDEGEQDDEHEEPGGHRRERQSGKCDVGSHTKDVGVSSPELDN
jgi:hypothetical protein